MHRHKAGKAITYILTLTALAAASLVGISYYFSTSSIHTLLTENHKLNEALHNLTAEEQIGYATLQSQTRQPDGTLISTIRFVQTAAGNPKQIVSEQLFTIKGDTPHFDALIVKFGNESVQSGKQKALYLWRRIYSEATPPNQGEAIEIPGTAPERYYNVTQALGMKNRDIFWEAIWDLANEPEALSEYGIQAVFGNAIYTKFAMDRIYYFKINPSGQIYVEVFDAR